MRKSIALTVSVTLACLLAACDVPERRESPREIRPIVGEGDTANDAGASQPGWTINPKGSLNSFFDCLDENGVTLVSAHRGGPAAGFPENALETFAATMDAAPALIEMDVATSSDGVLFLMHDDTLERTTTGEGRADQAPFSDIASLKLEDKNGRRTHFSPPRFSDVLAFIKDRTIAQIDFKRSTRFEDVIDEVRKAGVEDRVILISYSLAQARRLHRLAPEMMISLSADNEDEFSETVSAGVPANRLLIFTGLDAPKPRLNTILDDRDVEVIFGTLGGRRSVDNKIAQSGDDTAYAEIAETGVDIIATDRPIAAYNGLKQRNLSPASGVCGIRKQ